MPVAANIVLNEAYKKRCPDPRPGQRLQMEQKQQHFFVVDDDPDILDLVTALLEGDGHKVTATSESEAALDRIVVARPDCVLIDLMMPGIDGIELCRLITSHEELREVKVIVVSAKPYEADRRYAFESGAHGYVTKPINKTNFVNQIMRIIKDRIEVRFWGVRGTLPVPGEGTLKYGGNTSCVSMEFARGHFLIFDAGTGIKGLSDYLMKLGRRRLEAKIFISHPHWDHINALPFFVPLYIPGNEFEILGASHGQISMREMISAQMDGIYFPIRIKQFGARVYFRNLDEETFELGDGITVRTKLLNHPGKCLGYRIDYRGRSVCYVTDNELELETNEFYNPFYVKNLTAFIKDADMVITDTTYSDAEYPNKIGWGHSSVSKVTELAHSAGVKTLCLFHHDPDQDDAAIDAKLASAERFLAERGSGTVCLAPIEGATFEV